MTALANRVLMLGLELGDGRLIDAWTRSGQLPVLQSLRQRGCWGWLDTSADLLHISAWPSIYTGTPPGEHGVYFTFQPAPGLQGYQRFHTGLYGQPTVWKLLDAAQHRCVVLDPPYAHPEAGFGGTLIYEWGSWAHYLAPGSVPPEAIKQLQQEVGAYPLGLEANDLGWGALDAASTRDKLLRAIQAKTAATRSLMQQPGWELLFSVFGETHVAGHYCLNAAAADDAAQQPLLLEIYRALDAAIGELIAAAGPDTTVLVVSGDRVAANHAGWHLLPEFLQRLGLQSDPKAPPPGAGADAPRRRRDPVKMLRDLLPKNFRKSLARLLPTAMRDKLAQRVDTADIDWSRTKVACLPTDLEGYLRINLKGREPQGIVAPGAEFEAVVAQITEALAELRDPATGEAVVREVIRTDRAFPGARQAWLPDLVVRWNGARPITRAHSPRVGTLAAPSPDPRPGTHAGPGFVLAAGPGVRAGAELQGGNILDIAPTLLARFGVAAPATMRGRVLPELTTG